MSSVIKIKKGLDIPLKGEANKIVKDININSYAIKPTDFHALVPKMMVKEGEEVKAGSPLFFDKKREAIMIPSPVSGVITEILRGPKRRIEEVRIKANDSIDYIDFGKSEPSTLSAGEIKSRLLKSGLWSLIRQRPYNVIADPEIEPRALFISAFDSAPLAPDYEFILKDQFHNLETGIKAINRLFEGKVHIGLPKSNNKSIFEDLQNVEKHYFQGPHPAGNVGVQIHHIAPVNKGEVVWTIHPQDIVTIGKLFNEGRYDSGRIIALTGSALLETAYFKVLRGTNIYEIVNKRAAQGELRFISGNVLSGKKIAKDGYLAYYDSQLSVIPEGRYFELFGWASPGFKKFSYSRSFLSNILPKREYSLDTNMHGGHRAMVMTGEYEKVFPMDIYPMQLIKAILIEDIDLMENLGIYEVDEEDFALCEFIDTSKTEIQAIVRNGLNMLRKELS